MLPTPDLSHLTKADYEHIYEPAEDTFILLDALEKDAGILQELRPTVCLEIGSGSGCASAFLGSIVRSSCAVTLATDINPRAAECTLRTGVQNQIFVQPVLASLAAPFSMRLRRKVDVLVFNPPYVPTEDDEADSAQTRRGIAGSWAGGLHGMALTDILLSQINDLLSPSGRFYLVAIKQNNVPEIQRRMLEKHGLHSKIVLHRRAGGEYLFVLCFTRQPDPQQPCT